MNKEKIFNFTLLLFCMFLLFQVNIALGSVSLPWEFVLGFESNDIASGSPAVGDDGTIYIGSCDGTFYAINPNGTLKWAFADAGIFGWTAAIGEDGTIFVTSGFRLFAINPDGTEKWSVQGDCYLNFVDAPAIAKDGTVYIGSNASTLFAFDPENGNLRWGFDIGYEGSVTNPVIGAGGTIYVGSTAFPPDPYGVFYAINPDGTEKWRFAVNNYSEETSAAIGNDGTVYFVAPGYPSGVTLYSFSPSGTKKWIYNAPSSPFGGYAYSSPVIGGDGNIYFGSWENLFAVSPNGSFIDKWGVGEVWGDGYPGYIYTPAIGADGKIYVASADFNIYVVNPYGFPTVDLFQGTDSGVYSSPAIAQNGALYIGCKYEIMGLQTDSLGSANSSWPLDRCNLKRTARADTHFITGFLFAQLRMYVIERHFQRGISKSLVSKLDSAIKSFKAGQIVAARNKLNAFINEVKAQRGKKIPRRIANDLISQAREIMELLPMPPRRH